MSHVPPPAPASPGRPTTDADAAAAAEGASVTSVDLAALLIAVGSKDEGALEELYEHTHRRVYGLVRRVLVDAELSADVTQEVFLALWQSTAATYDRTKGSAMAWLLALAHRQAVERIRQEQPRRALNPSWGQDHRETDYFRNPGAAAHQKDIASAAAGRAVLSPAQAEAIRLAYYTGLAYTDVAQRLAISTTTARTRITDGMRGFATGLADQGPG